MSTKNNKIHILTRGIFVLEDKILLCKLVEKDKPNFFFLPGGHVDAGETTEQALKREILEELGCNCEIKNFLGHLEYIFDNKKSILCHLQEYNFVYEVEIASLSLSKPLPKLEDHIDFHWVKLEDIDNINLRPETMKSKIKEWTTYKLQPSF